MAKIVVNTDEIKNIALKLQKKNNNINYNYKKIEKKINNMHVYYTSPSSNVLCHKGKELGKLNEERSKVLQNYIEVLNQNVAIGYESTENENQKYAKLFK